MIEQRLAGDLRDARNRAERGFRGGGADVSLRDLRIGRPAPPLRFRAPLSNSMEPPCGILEIVRSDDLHAEVADGDKHAADRSRSERACVQVLTLDQQIGESSDASESTELRPEGATNHVSVKAADGLAFDERSLSDFVVASPEAANVDLTPKRLEVAPDAPGFALIDRNSSHRRSIHLSVCRVSAGTVSTPKQLAVSRSESARP